MSKTFVNLIFYMKLHFLIKKLFISGRNTTYNQNYEKYLNRSLLSKYSTQNHPSRKRRFQCSTCGKSYSCVQNLSRHLRLECNVEPKFSCLNCGKKFKHKHRMYSHKKSQLCRGITK